MLAYNEETGETGYYTVTAVIAHVDPSIVELTIDGDPSASSGTETLETTAEHPFYVVASAPPALSLVEGWLVTGETEGRWVNAGELEVGDAVRQADGTTGMVHAVVVVERRQPMYNLTVAVAHTFFVGQQQWLVHNCSVKVEVSRSKYPESAQHIEDAQAAGHPKDLTIDRSGKNANRQESLSGTDRVPGKDRDEYPPAMFQEGGSGASVRPIDPSDNRGAGACIGNQCRGLPDGTNVEIVVVP